MIERMRPMDSAPRDGTAVLLWWKMSGLDPDCCRWDVKLEAWVRGAGDNREWADDLFAGWTPIVRPLEPDACRCEVWRPTFLICDPCKNSLPDGMWMRLVASEQQAERRAAEMEIERFLAPEPEPAPILPPTPQRLRLQIVSAARESVALGQSLAAFQALAGVAHARATKRAEGAR